MKKRTSIFAAFCACLLLLAAAMTPLPARAGLDDHFVIMRVVGDVQVRESDRKRWRQARVGEVLSGGDTQIKTDEDSALYLKNGETYEPKSRPTLAIGPKARVRIRSERDARKHRRKILDVQRGKVTRLA